METRLNKGDQVIIHTREGKMLKAVFDHMCPNGYAYVKAEDGKAYERKPNSLKKVGEAETDFVTTGAEKSFDSVKLTVPKTHEWDINRRFDFLAQLVRMIINKTSVSLIVTGEGGLGKSFTVRRQIELKKLVKFDDFVMIKGFSTPRGLYRILYENSDKLIIFDDCDEVLEDKIAKNLLKGALDSFDEREIHWITKTSDPSLPDSFIFTGKIIFISNMSQDRIEQALLSRSMCIDLTMSTQDKINRMQFIIDNGKQFMPEYSKMWKQESLDIIKDNLADVRELSLRSLEKVLKIRAGEKDVVVDVDVENPTMPIEWKDLAKFMLLS